jgi:hypothetical protein
MFISTNDLFYLQSIHLSCFINFEYVNMLMPCMNDQAAVECYIMHIICLFSNIYVHHGRLKLLKVY